MSQKITKNKTKLLVIQEQHFTKLPNGQVWVDKQSDIAFWDRYLNVFDEIVVCARMKESNELGVKALRSDRDRVSFIAMPDFRGVVGIVKHYFRIQKALSTALKQVDCVIFRAPSPISMVSYSIVRRSKKAFAVELMNNPKTHFSSKSMHHFYQPLIQMFITNQTKRMCRCANGVAYVTDFVLQNLYPSKFRLDKNCNNKLYFESAYSTINLSQENYIKEVWPEQRPEPIVFIHSGEMSDYRKGQHIFIEALAELKRRKFSVKGILIGDGILRSEFERMVETFEMTEDIEFVGWKSGFINVQKELLKGHVFIFPSTGEGLPRSVIEAMASGLICFWSDIDGVSELLTDDLLVNKFEGIDFADHIEKYLVDWDLTLKTRDVLFENSKKFINTKLERKRTEFYEKLKLSSEFVNKD